MKTRPLTTRRCAAAPRFALHPLSFAVCMAMSGAALALPQGGNVVAGTATIGTPTPGTEVVKQSSDKAIIDWTSFSIAAGEKVRFYQPSSSAVTLNRVTGYDPSYILGQMSSNGKIFLVNPYGVVFGAGARVDVGGLVVSTLSIANSDFLASRYSLTSVDPAAPAQRGEVRNEGTISAPGGLVVLAAPSVTNTGTIVAEGGRVGLVAANSVSIDVEGDGLIFFQANATEAKNRLQQLGRIQADGGTIEMRAVARGAFADTVLNMSGIVQARSLGSREGRVVIDGGSEGTTVVSGQIDVSGRASGEHGGTAVVEGQQLALADTARIDASGDAGGGAIRIGGGFHGSDPGIRDADTTSVAANAQLTADALTNGNGGTVVVWSDHGTTYQGTISARGGAVGGDGGSVEVSGRDSLNYRGLVDTRAPAGKTGTLLLDPTDITISDSPDTASMTPSGGDPNTFSDVTAQNSTLNTTTLQTALGTASVIVDTTSLLGGGGTISVQKPILDWANSTSLTLKADSTITISAGSTITNTGTGGLNLFANGGITLNAAVSLAGGSFVVANKAGTGRAPSFTAGALGTISTAGGAGAAGGLVDIETTGAISTQAITTSGGTSSNVGKAAGGVTLNSNGGTVTTNGAITALGGAASGGNRAGGAGGVVALGANGLLTIGADITTTGGAPTGSGAKGLGGTIGLQGNGVTVNAGLNLDADDNTILVNGGGGAIQLGTSTLTTTSNLANALTIQNATTVALGNLGTGASGTTTLGVSGNITGAVSQTPATTINTGTLTGSTTGSVALGNANAVATLGAFSTTGAFALNDAGGGLGVSGAVSTGGSGLASIATTGGNLAVSGSVSGAGVSLTTSGAHNIALSGPINGNAGMVTLTSGQNITQTSSGTINTTAALVLSAAGAITLDQGNTIASLGTVTRGGAFALNDTTGGLTLSGDVGTAPAPVSLTTAGGALDLNSHNITTTTGAGTVALTGVGVSQTSGGIVAGGTTSVNGGTGSIALQSATNDFTGAVTLTSSGTDASVASLNDLTLGSLGGIGAATNVTAIAGGTLTLPGPSFTTSGSIDLRSLGGTLATNGALDGGAVSLTGSTGVTITKAVTATTLALTSTNAAVAESGSGVLNVSGITTVNAGAGSIALTKGNDFQGAVSLNNSGANNVAITDTNALVLGASNVGSGTLGINTSGNVTQTGAITQAGGAGAVTITVAGGSVDALLNTQANNFSGGVNFAGGTYHNVGLRNDNAAAALPTLPTGLNDLSVVFGNAAASLNLPTTTLTGNLVATAGNAVTESGALHVAGSTSITAGSTITLTQANDFQGAVSLSGTTTQITDTNALTLGTLATGALTATSTGALNLGSGSAASINATSNGGAVSQSGPLTVAGTTSVNAGAGSIALTQANDFQGAVSLAGAATQITDTNALTLGTLATGALTATSTGALNLGSGSAASINATSNGGAVSQSGPLTVAGTTSVNAGAGSIALTQANDFQGAVSLSGTTTQITDTNALTLGTLATGALTATSTGALNLGSGSAASINATSNGGAVSQSGPLTVAGTTSVNAGAGSIALTQANDFQGAVSLAGAATQITDINALTLGPTTATSLTVDTSSGNGAVSQSGPLTVTGPTTVNAGAGSIALTQANDFQGAVSLAGTATQITDTNALTLGTLATGALTATSTGALNLGSGSAASINATSNGGAVSQSGPLTVAGTTSVNAGAGSIALTQANDFQGAVSLNNSGANNVALTDTNALVLGASSTGSGPLAINAGGNITESGAITTTGSVSIAVAGGSVDVRLDTQANNFGGGVSFLGGGYHNVGLRDVNAGATLPTLPSGLNNLSVIFDNAPITLPTTSLTGNLVATAAGPISETGALNVAGTTTINAGAGTITLTQANDFQGAVSLNNSGANNVAITDTNALVLGASNVGSGTLGINTSGNVTQTGAITQAGGAGAVTITVAGGSVDALLNTQANNFSGGVNFAGGTYHNVGLRNDNAAAALPTLPTGLNDLSVVFGNAAASLNLPTTTLTGNLVATAGNAVTESGALHVAGSTSITAGSTITLTQANDFQGAVSLSGTTTQITDTNALTLGTLATGALTATSTGALNLGSGSAASINATSNGGAVSQSGPLTVAGTTSVNAGAGSIALTQANDFQGAVSLAGAATQITDINALTLGPTTATSLTVDTSSGNGAVSQSGPLTVAGTTSVNAGAGSIALTQANDFQGAVSLAGAATQITDTNALTLGTLATGALTATSTGALNLGSGSAASINATSNGGAVSQSGPLTVAGTTSVNAGAGSIALTQANDFQGAVSLAGAATQITDINALTLGPTTATSLTVDTSSGNGAVSQTGAALVGGTTTITAGTGAVTLTNTGNNFATLAVTGGAVSIKDVNAIVLGAINAASLSVDTSVGNGAVTQSGAAIVSGPSTVSAGTGAITLNNAGNDFATLAISGGAATIVDSNALSLTSLSSAPNQAVTVTAGGALTLPATPIDTGSAALSLSSGGPLTSAGTLRGTNVALSSGAAMTLANNVTSLGTLSLSSSNAAITQTSGTIVAAGAATVNAGSGDIALAQASNDFQGSVALTGGAVSARDVNSLTVTGLASGANQPVSLIAGGSLVLPGTAIDTGSANLTLQALGGSLVINSALSGNQVTLTGSAGLTLGANITSTGDQIYTTPVQIAGNVTLNAGASHIDLQGGANGGGNNLALTSSNAAADAIHTGAPITNTAQFTVTGNSTLGGNVTSTGNQTYTGPVVLGADVTLAAGTAKIDLQGAVDAAGHSLALTSSNAAADAIDAAAPISNAAQLTVTGKSTLASGVSTTGAQIYSDTVTLASNSNFSGSNLGFGNGIVAGAFDLGLRADTLNIVGVATGSGNVTLSSASQAASVGLAGGAGTYQVSQATLNGFSSFASLTVGRADGTGDITAGNLVLPTNLAVTSGSGNASFNGTIDSVAGQSRSLSVATAGTTTFAGAVGGAIGGSAALGNLSIAGATHLNASTTTTGTQSFGGDVAIGADATLSSSALAFGAGLDVGTHALTMFTDALGIAGAATGGGGGSIRLAPKDATGSIGLAGGTGTLQVSATLIDTLAGVPTLTLGRNDGTGTITIGSLVLPADLAISDGGASVAFTGSIDSAAGPARSLSVNTTGTTSFVGTIGAVRPLDTLTVSGSSQLGGNVTTSGAQTYTGQTTLLADSTLSAPSVAFGSTVDGGHALAVNATSTSFGGAVGGAAALTSLTTDAAGITHLGGNVTTSAAQSYGDALQLNAGAALTASTLHLAGSVDGGQALALNSSAGTTLSQAIGAATPLTGLTVTGPLQLNAGAVTTTGAQSYAGPATLGAATSLTAASIAFGSTLDGAVALGVQSSGTTSFAGAVGATAPLASFAASGGGAVQLSGPSITTSGAQSYSGALLLAGNTQLTGSSLNLGGPVSGAADLTLQTNALTGGASIAGTGTLTIAPIDPTVSIGVAGGAGTLQVPQAVLDGASGFSTHVIGRSDGSGTVSTGNLVLRADTTLQTASGDIDLGGSVDGAFALALNSGATTRIAGPIGTVTPLKSLTTDNNAAAADWDGTSGERTTFDTADGTGGARVVTTGAQTYNDPVTTSVPVVFNGGAITATQAGNRFGGIVSASADSLQLHSSADLQLGTITLANGGTVDTDGVLHITGTLKLDGGTLVLTANATPTSIDITDPELQSKHYTFGFVPIQEASATIVEDAGATLTSSAGSLIAFRSPNGGTLQLDQPGNTLLGNISAVSGKLNDTDQSRFTNATTLTLGFIRIASSEIHVAGAPPSNSDQTVTQAGVEGDVIKLSTDVLTTGTDGLIRSRLPFNNVQGSQTSVPGITFVMSPTALSKGGSFGSPSPDNFIRIQVGGAEGGFVTADPKNVGGENAVIFLGGSADVRPFYDENGKSNEIRIFYNGDAPRTPQEAGALAAVIALIEEARHVLFEEAVRTENVSSRLRSGVIAEVGAGRPATVGRESIRLPDTCDIRRDTNSLLCE